MSQQYTDAETGFQYLRARYYDPATGQFLTRDPIEAVTREAYGYVGGNPLNANPLGLGPFDFVGDAWDATGGKAVSYVNDHKVGILKGTSYVLAGGAIVAAPFTGGTSLSALPTVLAFGSGGTAIAAEALDPKPKRAQRVTLAVGLFMLGGGGVAGAFGEAGWPWVAGFTDAGLLGVDFWLGGHALNEDCVPVGAGSW